MKQQLGECWRTGKVPFRSGKRTPSSRPETGDLKGTADRGRMAWETLSTALREGPRGDEQLGREEPLHLEPVELKHAVSSSKKAMKKKS